jgi:hypothetical protein
MHLLIPHGAAVIIAYNGLISALCYLAHICCEGEVTTRDQCHVMKNMTKGPRQKKPANFQTYVYRGRELLYGRV